MKYILFGPEGHPVRPYAFDTLTEVAEATAKFMMGVMLQGHYRDSSMQNRTPLWVAESMRVESDADEDEEPTPAEDAEWVSIGEVGVDSGQLMICDPCYIGSEWKSPDESDRPAAPLLTHQDGTVLYCTLHGRPLAHEAIGFGNYEEVVEKYGKTPNDMLEAGELKRSEVPDKCRGEFSYTGACEVTLAKQQAGEMVFKMGHTGAGVAFSSGLGDGFYTVYARYVDLPDWGRRVAEVRVVMLSKEDMEDEDA